MDIKDSKIAIIGLGYVGLPLAVAFADKYKVVGIDISNKRIQELQSGRDATLEVEDAELKAAIQGGFVVSTDINDAADCNVFIVTVPTPTDKHNRPVLTPMIKASEAIAGVIAGRTTSRYNLPPASSNHSMTSESGFEDKPVIIYESTVYPGVTEDEMVPVLERVSGLKYNEDFFVGYSP
jgi:UDP-N-acetyl-D-galactosamine dehydrogenase